MFLIPCHHCKYIDWRPFFCSGQPFDPVPLLNSAVANIICQIVFGRRFDFSDHDFQSMLKNLAEIAYLEGSIWALVRRHSHTDTHRFVTWKYSTENIQSSSEIFTCRWIKNKMSERVPWFFSKQLYDACPALMKHLPGPHNGIFSNSKSLEASIRREIERHKLDLNPSDPRDYIDTFLIAEKVLCSHSWLSLYRYVHEQGQSSF